jgi:hypothetical protein
MAYTNAELLTKFTLDWAARQYGPATERLHRLSRLKRVPGDYDEPVCLIAPHLDIGGFSRVTHAAHAIDFATGASFLEKELFLICSQWFLIDR